MKTINCPLFEGIEELDALLGCLSARRVTYKRGGFIFQAEERAGLVGIVLSGGANIIQEDFWGNRTILNRAEPGDIFGEAFSCAGEIKLPVSVVASEASEIMLIDYRKIITVCTSACVFHARLISNMLRILAQKNIMLTRKVEYISKRTTREKVLSYLSSQAVKEGKSDFLIPYNRQEMADLLCVERSALSRELGEMKKEGLIDYNKNRFALK